MRPTIAQLLADDPDRYRHFRAQGHDWWLDFTHLPMDRSTRDQLQQAFMARDPDTHIRALLEGQAVNRSEDQPAWHTQLRADDDRAVVDQRQHFLAVADQWFTGKSGLSDIIHIGIGGSDLGPRLVADALDEGTSAVNVHWVSTVDSRRLHRLLARLNPETTGVLVASKSFSTEETLLQARQVAQWLGERWSTQAWAATAQPEKAQREGFSSEQILTFPSWTGGRFSLWSSVGVSAAAAIGPAAFEALLEGAHQADQAFASATVSPDQHLAVWLGLIIHYLRRDLDLNTLGIVAYEPRLALLGDYCQQLFMESLGKQTDLSDRPLSQPTIPLIFGGRGTDLQHSIFQALHQGLDTHPLLLVGCLSDPQGDREWHQVQMAHLLAQRQAFAHGRVEGAPYQQMPGNRPVAILACEQLTPQGLGYLLASLEHAVYTLAMLWDVNAFDQWGVEEGKRLAGPIRERLTQEAVSVAKALGWDPDHH